MKNNIDERMAQISIVLKTLQGALDEQLNNIFMAYDESEEKSNEQ